MYAVLIDSERASAAAPEIGRLYRAGAPAWIQVVIVWICAAGRQGLVVQFLGM